MNHLKTSILIFLLIVSCSKSNKKGKVATLTAQISKVTVLDNQIVLTGMNFTTVTDFKIIDGSTTHSLIIESKSDNEIIAKSTTNVSLPIGEAINFIISDSNASANFTLEVSFCRTFLNGGTFECTMKANDKEVLSYNSATSTWRPQSLNGLSYKGFWDSNDPFPTGANAGDYFVVNVRGPDHDVGDWVIYNGSVFEKIENAERIINVFGRTGNIADREGDYSLPKLSDVTYSEAPVNGSILVFDGTTWAPKPFAAIIGSTSSFTGDKKFEGMMNVSGGVKIGQSSSSCSGTTEGTLRYNSALKVFQTCNSASWE